MRALHAFSFLWLASVATSQTNVEQQTAASEPANGAHQNAAAQAPTKPVPCIVKSTTIDFFAAVAGGDAAHVRELLPHNDVNARDCEAKTPLYVAVTEQQTATVELLLEKGADPNLRVGGNTALVPAVVSDRLDLVDKLVKYGADVNARTDNGYVLLEAVKESGPAVVVALLSRGANARAADPNGRTGVMFAVKRGDLEMLRSLLMAGADANACTWDGTRAIHLAFQQDRLDMMNVLLDSGADANTRSETGTLLTDAVSAGKAELVKLLVGRGASVTEVDGEGQTPLAIARAKGHFTIESLLIAGGARD